MAELVWPGKYRDGVRVATAAPAVPITTDEVHDGPRVTGSDQPPWRNRLVAGDVSTVLPSLLPELAGKVALVYVDPPFDTGSDFDFQATIPGAPDDAPRVAVPAYSDARGLDAWIAWFADAAAGLRELLCDGGSLYVHLDSHVAHYAKIVLDEVFGPGAFQREIVWRIGWVSGYKSRSRGWVRNHDTLLFYAKGGRPATFHKEYLPYPEGYVRRDGKPPRGEGVPLDDVWNASPLDRMDSIQIVSFSGEKVGYPTQKNEALVSRIIRASSSPGDVVLDCFVGSGTTAIVAEKLGRRWVACDSSPIAIHTTRKRLLSLPAAAPLAIQHAAPPRPARRVRHRDDEQGRSLKVRVRVTGKEATIDLVRFALAASAMADVPAAARAGVAHWSQWLEGYCIDWDHRAGVLNSGSGVWRARGQARLPLATTHAYERAGRYVALVKAFDRARRCRDEGRRGRGRSVGCGAHDKKNAVVTVRPLSRTRTGGCPGRGLRAARILARPSRHLGAAGARHAAPRRVERAGSVRVGDRVLGSRRRHRPARGAREVQARPDSAGAVAPHPVADGRPRARHRRRDTRRQGALLLVDHHRDRPGLENRRAGALSTAGDRRRGHHVARRDHA